MLLSLHIKNMAVIKEINIDFEKGFTAITGETGAGKSVMLSSLYLLAGAKADRELIRHGEELATVSALFAELQPQTLDSLASLSVFPDDDGYLEISRSFNTEGRNLIHINGKTVSLSLLKEVFPLLMHIHSQEDNGFLRKEGSEILVLDTVAHNQQVRAAYQSVYRKMVAVQNEIHKLSIDESEKIRTIEALRYQIGEIDAVSPVPDEEETLYEEKIKLKHHEKIAKQAGFAYRALRGAEKGNACYIIDRAIAALSSLEDVLPQASATAAALEAHLLEIETLADEIPAFADLGNDDPTAALDAVETRLSSLEKLTRKYGGTLEKVCAFREEAQKKLAMLEGADEKREELEKALQEIRKEALTAAERLHETREKAARLLEKEIVENLRKLDMPKAEFSISLEKEIGSDGCVLGENGFDRVCFMAAVNVGEPYVSIAKSASGGEMSRIMLAIKTVIARFDGLPTVIFDEIDSGVSGKTSRKIGFCLLESAKTAQVLSITHSAQIASLADRHLLVRKTEKAGRTESSVSVLSDDERMEELARILGGISVTEAQRQAAKDMLRYREM